MMLDATKSIKCTSCYSDFLHKLSSGLLTTALGLLSAHGIKELAMRTYVKEVYVILKRRHKSLENYKDITDHLHIPKC